MDFNPHSHAGSDFWTWSIKARNTISIHTPTQGVTHAQISQELGHTPISIHTPTQGVTLFFQTDNKASRFQSTLPRREWPQIPQQAQGLVDFNPHSHAGSDLCYPQLVGTITLNSGRRSSKNIYEFFKNLPSWSRSVSDLLHFRDWF